MRIAVTPDKRQKGIDSLSQTARMFDVRDLNEALQEHWAEDAHFVVYSVVGPDGKEQDKWPRINKPCLGELIAAGARVECNMMVLDYDTNMNVTEEVLLAHGWNGDPKKLPKIEWTPERRAEFADLFAGLRQYMEEAEVAMPTIVYLTKHGARFIHLLATPIAAQDFEPRLAGLVELYADAGLRIDTACKDWTRMFRLPHVMRDGKPTWEAPYITEPGGYSEDWEEWLVWEGIEPTAPSKPVDHFASIQTRNDPMPDPHQVMELLETEGSQGRTKQTERVKRAKSWLRGRDVCDIIFEHKPLAAEGSRDVTLTRLVGEVVKMLHGKDGFEPDFVFALFYQAVEQLEPDEGTPDWFAKLWYLVLRFWSKEDALMLAYERELAVKQAETDEKLDRIVDTTMETNKTPELHVGSDVERRTALAHQLILRCGPMFYIMRPDGYYDPQAVDKFALPTFIRQHGMDDVIELVKEGRDGLIYKRPEDLMLEYGRVIGEVRGRIGVAGGLFDGETLHVPMYRRHPDRQAVYHEDVARWLSLMVCKEDLPLLHKWIGYSLDFEGGPICAVSIAGPPAVGKKLFARGLQECIDTEQAARGQALTAEYNAVLRRTPWLVIDEGMPTLRRGAEPADVFRELVSGEDFITRNPYEAPVTVNNPMRIIMTANNLDVVHALTKSRDLSVEDQEALAQRILHFTAREEAATWLKSKGGRRFTDGWIRGDGGHRESDYVVAEHFMWLYEHRHDFGQPEERLLVQGNAQSEIIQQMRTQSGAAPRVVELILGLVGTNPANLGQQYRAGMAEVEEGTEPGFYITADAIKRYHSDQMTAERMTITHKRAGMVLSSLSIRTEKVNPTLIALDGQEYRLRWWRLDLPALLDRALEYGIPCERLTRLVQKHHPDAPVLKRVNLS